MDLWNIRNTRKHNSRRGEQKSKRLQFISPVDTENQKRKERSRRRTLDAVKVYFNCHRCELKSLRKIFTVLSQMLIILIVWEFLRSSSETTENADELLKQFNLKPGNLLNCFQKLSPGDILDLNSIISRDKAVHPTGGTRRQHVLSVDVIIRAPGSSSVTVYTAGSTIVISDAEIGSHNEMLTIDYFEYNDDDTSNNLINNDDDTSNNLINNDFVDKKDILISMIQPASINEGVRMKRSQFQVRNDRFNLSDESSLSVDTARQDKIQQAESRAMDVMLVEDQMLKVQPKDQLQQQEILQLLNRRKNVKLLLQNRARRLRDEILEKLHAKGGTINDQSELQKSQQTTTGRDDPEINERHNQSQGLTRAWPDVVLDETSEPLYAEGFLERVQRVKSQLYSNPMFYNITSKEKIRKFYLLNNPDLCLRTPTVDLVYLVHSQPENMQDRQRLRQTILNSDNYKNFTIVRVFLTGKSIVHEVQHKLKSESELYGDIVQGDFIDTRQKRAWKGLMGMRWVLQFCRKVHFVLKINDNVFVDTDKLVRGLIPTSASIIGKRAMLCALSPDDSSALDNLPVPFCDGFAVLMTRHLVCSIVASSNQIRVPTVEDYYLYGILPYVIGGVGLFNLSGNHGFQKRDTDALSCYRDLKDTCPILATQYVTDNFSTLWAITEAGKDKSGNWHILWDLRSVKSYLS